LLASLATHILAPSNVMRHGLAPTPNVPMILPLLACSFVTVLSPLLATHIFTPSKAMPQAPFPTVKTQVPRHAPSLARSLVTVLLPRFATQIFAPSKASSVGMGPRLVVNNAEIFPGYQRSNESSSGLAGF